MGGHGYHGQMTDGLRLTRRWHMNSEGVTGDMDTVIDITTTTVTPTNIAQALPTPPRASRTWA